MDIDVDIHVHIDTDLDLDIDIDRQSVAPQIRSHKGAHTYVYYIVIDVYLE